MDLEQEMDWNLISQLLSQLSIVHHVRGRVRVRLKPSVLNLLPKIKNGRAEDWLAQLPGITDLRLNLSAASLVIQYDSQRIQPQWWERVVRASRPELPALFAEIGVVI